MSKLDQLKDDLSNNIITNAFKGLVIYPLSVTSDFIKEQYLRATDYVSWRHRANKIFKKLQKNGEFKFSKNNFHHFGGVYYGNEPWEVSKSLKFYLELAKQMKGMSYSLDYWDKRKFYNLKVFKPEAEKNPSRYRFIFRSFTLWFGDSSVTEMAKYHEEGKPFIITKEKIINQYVKEEDVPRHIRDKFKNKKQYYTREELFYRCLEDLIIK